MATASWFLAVWWAGRAGPLGGWLTDADQASPHEGDPAVYAVSAQREFRIFLVARARSLVLLREVAERLRDSCRQFTNVSWLR